MEKSTGRIVVVGYKPLPNKENELKTALKDHLQVLRKEGLATDRAPIVMRSAAGIFIEVFEWKSKGAIEQAHTNAEVQKLWMRFSECCTYVPVSEANEVFNLFSEFEAI
jgi:hypothetical protein